MCGEGGGGGGGIEQMLGNGNKLQGMVMYMYMIGNIEIPIENGFLPALHGQLSHTIEE